MYPQIYPRRSRCALLRQDNKPFGIDANWLAQIIWHSINCQERSSCPGAPSDVSGCTVSKRAPICSGIGWSNPYGRICTRGRQIRYAAQNEVQAKKLVRETLGRRATARKRNGVPLSFLPAHRFVPVVPGGAGVDVPASNVM